MKTYDVIVERNNGHFRALFPALPNIAAEGATRDEAVAAATVAAQQYLREVEITTVHLAEPVTSSRQTDEAEREWSLVEQQYPLAAAWLRSAGLTPQDPNDPDYQQYLAVLAADKERQREEARKQQEPRYRPTIEREFAIAAEVNSPDAEMRRGSLQSVLRAAADCRIDTTTELYKEYVADLVAEKERQRAEAEREADESEAQSQ